MAWLNDIILFRCLECLLGNTEDTCAGTNTHCTIDNAGAPTGCSKDNTKPGCSLAAKDSKTLVCETGVAKTDGCCCEAGPTPCNTKEAFCKMDAIEDWNPKIIVPDCPPDTSASGPSKKQSLNSTLFVEKSCVDHLPIFEKCNCRYQLLSINCIGELVSACLKSKHFRFWYFPGCLNAYGEKDACATDKTHCIIDANGIPGGCAEKSHAACDGIQDGDYQCKAGVGCCCKETGKVCNNQFEVAKYCNNFLDKFTNDPNYLLNICPRQIRKLLVFSFSHFSFHLFSSCCFLDFGFDCFRLSQGWWNSGGLQDWPTLLRGGCRWTSRWLCWWDSHSLYRWSWSHWWQWQ